MQALVHVVVKYLGGAWGVIHVGSDRVNQVVLASNHIDVVVGVVAAHVDQPREANTAQHERKKKLRGCTDGSIKDINLLNYRVEKQIEEIHAIIQG